MMPHSYATTIQAPIAGMNATSRAATISRTPTPSMKVWADTGSIRVTSGERYWSQLTRK